MNKILYFLAIPALLSAPAAAVADPGDWYLGGAIVYTDDDPDRRLDDVVGGGQINVGRRLTDVFALEGRLAYSDIEGWPDWPVVTEKGNQEFLDIGIDLLSHLNPDGSFSPYLLLGAGYLGTKTNSGSEENRPSGSAGLGFEWKLGDSALSIRGDYRFRLAWEEDNSLTDRIATLGLQYSFGHRRSAPPVIDSDNDGIQDVFDQCPHSDAGVTVDSTGCEIFVDSDGDGIMDRQDLCANTPEGAPVDKYGCLRDLDGDGVTDDIDECPNTVSGAAIYVNGCERDDDGDNVVNHLDECPNTRANAPVDARGCEIGSTVELRGVNFASNSDRLLTGAEQVLDDAIEWLKKNPHLIVEVAGHTDSDGAASANLGLSERRAYTVRDYLIYGGIGEARLTARGYGESEPIADNATTEGKAENRRVELRILNNRE
jgi:OOP family OmpA-OmpF porin